MTKIPNAGTFFQKAGIWFPWNEREHFTPMATFHVTLSDINLFVMDESFEKIFSMKWPEGGLM